MFLFFFNVLIDFPYKQSKLKTFYKVLAVANVTYLNVWPKSSKNTP